MLGPIFNQFPKGAKNDKLEAKICEEPSNDHKYEMIN